MINVILVMIISVPLINLLARWNAEMNLPEFMEGIENRIEEMEIRAENLTDTFLESNTIFQYLLNLAMIAILPAVGEELVFRGIIQRILIN